MDLPALLNILDYDQSQYYHDLGEARADTQVKPSTEHVFRAARRLNVDGVYLFRTSPKEPDSTIPELLPARPAVFVAKAESIAQARDIHRGLWNLGQAPFIIILMPSQLRVYTGFRYSPRSDDEGLIVSTDHDHAKLLGQIADFSAASIDSGGLWQSRSQDLDPKGRVDKRLLRNLLKLGSLLTTGGLHPEVAHALIGKYVYISYLRDRRILSDQWLDENGIKLESVLGRQATVKGLGKLVDALEAQFNGNVFPIDLRGKSAPRDDHVALVASVFKGDIPYSDSARQLHLDFKAYDFQYIPVETLSSIYEQFLHTEGRGRSIGAIYTPEILADYLISELNSEKPLSRGMRILDPACGSGVFLVLVYRRLIEAEVAKRRNRKLLPSELREILLESIYGVERERDACYVAEFSLILTLLDYVEPPDLHRNGRFRFPALHNTHIFESDFFDDTSEFWKRQTQFDWILGNPPWIKLNATGHEEKYVRAWMEENRANRPVGDYRVSEAFSWRSFDRLKDDGMVGLILHAKSLVNQKSVKYRTAFFDDHEILRITNFSNLRHVLFRGRSTAPAMTVVCRKAPRAGAKRIIVHYGPFLANQVPSRSSIQDNRLWVITINENEITTVSPADAETGDAWVWKMALWGTNRDRRAMERLRALFPSPLVKLCGTRGWYLAEGPQLRRRGQEKGLEHVPFLQGKKVLNTFAVNRSRLRFSIPRSALDPIPSELCYKRRGEIRTEAPHVVISASWSYATYSDEDFLTPPRQICLFGPKSDAKYLKAISVFLSSSIVRYYLFFQVPDWGTERDRITLKEVKGIPTPNFTQQHIDGLADIQDELAASERQGLAPDLLQRKLDERVNEILSLPEDLYILANDFVQLRLGLNEGRTQARATERPDLNDLRSYAEQLATELDSFAEDSGVHHRVTLTPDRSLVMCTVGIIKSRIPFAVSAATQTDRDWTADVSKIQGLLKEQFSQWVYVQRGLRVFDGPKAYILKTPRLIDWTRSQALNDADDIIGEVLNAEARAA